MAAHRLVRPSRHALLIIATLALAACATEPSRPVTEVRSPPPALPDTTVYFYPQADRAISAEQQDRDKFECNAWAVEQTGFDPSSPDLPPQQRVRVVRGGPPPGTGTAVGAVTGAALGGVLSSPWHTGPGLVFGAITGAAIGTIAEAASNEQANQAQTRADADARRARDASLERKASDYRRAMSACLEGRGYSVR